MVRSRVLTYDLVDPMHGRSRAWPSVGGCACVWHAHARPHSRSCTNATYDIRHCGLQRGQSTQHACGAVRGTRLHVLAELPQQLLLHQRGRRRHLPHAHARTRRVADALQTRCRRVADALQTRCRRVEDAWKTRGVTRSHRTRARPARQGGTGLGVRRPPARRPPAACRASHAASSRSG